MPVLTTWGWFLRDFREKGKEEDKGSGMMFAKSS
jgi:hypothetical protein